ncbi:MAG: hypothetical protein JWN73_4354 [Betaproteobacteria bacterium]|nr:hypothetical protein [Betaproteobacteria bacterium]
MIAASCPAAARVLATPATPTPPPPTLPEFIGAYGAERRTQLHSEMTDKLSQNQYRQNFAALPSAEVERARSDAQAGLHATARANAETLGAPAPADTGTDGNDSAFTLRTQADVADPHYAAQSREATNLQSAAAAILTARAQDPVQAGIDAGAFGLKPADMSSPQAVLASAATRGPVVGVIADTYNTGRSAFTNSEFADLSKTAVAMPPQARGPFFKQLADKLGDSELVRATFKRLGADNPVLAEAARMQFEEQANQPGPANGASGVISAPEHMYKGFTALNPTDGSPPQAMPADAQTRAAFTPSEGEDPGAAETRYQATRAIYASLAKDDSDKSGQFDAKRWQVAQNLATNGSGTAGEVGLGTGPVASSRLSENGTPVGNQLHADLERVMLGKNPLQEGDGAPAAAQSSAMDILDPDKPNPTLAKQEENPVQLALNTTGQEFTGESGGAPFVSPPPNSGNPQRFSRPTDYIDELDKNKKQGDVLATRFEAAEQRLLKAKAKDSKATPEERQAAQKVFDEAERTSHAWNRSRIEILEKIEQDGGGLQPDEEAELANRRGLDNWQAVNAINTQGAARFGNVRKIFEMEPADKARIMEGEHQTSNKRQKNSKHRRQSSKICRLWKCVVATWERKPDLTKKRVNQSYIWMTKLGRNSNST